MTSSRLCWVCSGLTLLGGSLLAAEIKRSDLDTLMPNRRVKAEGMGEYAIQEDIGPYWFWRTRVKSEDTEWGDPRTGTTCRVEYRENGTNMVDVTIMKYEVSDMGRWFFHDMEGEMMAKAVANRVENRIANREGSFMYCYSQTSHATHVGAIWHNGKDTFVGVLTGRSTNFPTAIVSAYLKKIPSAMKKTDLYNKDYDAWCRVEIPRRISDLEALDWNGFMTESERGPNRDKWRIAVSTIANLIHPVKDKTTPEDEEFFRWLKERLLKPDSVKSNGVAAAKQDVKTLRKWWENRKDTYRSDGRTHKTR